jgi:hypothetical protein
MSIHTTILEVRVMSPVDLAVSKLARFGDADRDDIEILAPCAACNAGAVDVR